MQRNVVRSVARRYDRLPLPMYPLYRCKRERLLRSLLLLVGVFALARFLHLPPPAPWQPDAMGTERIVAAPRYTIQDLGSIGGPGAGAVVQANGLGGAGDVAGVYRRAGDGTERLRSFLWRGGKAIDLGTLGGQRSFAGAVSVQGQVVGQSQTADGHFFAFLWQNGKMKSLGTLDGDRGLSAATAVNEKGQVVGFTGAGTPGRQYRGMVAFLWQGGTMTELEALPSHPLSEAWGVSEDGVIVGAALRKSTDGGETRFRAVLWDEAGQVRDLGTLGGEDSVAYGVNASGQVVGVSSVAEDTDGAEAFLWQKGQRIRGLGRLPGFASSVAKGVNGQGDVVGYSASSCSEARACLWRGGKLYDLNDCIPGDSDWDLRRAVGINDCGQIVGHGIHEGAFRSFLLTPRS